MREIKFRAYDTRINTMYPYVKLCWNGSIEARLDPDDPSTVADITMRHANGDHDDYGGEIVVMQFTSLKDKNGKEIYEGDVLECMSLDYSCTCGCKSNILITEPAMNDDGTYKDLTVQEYDPSDKCKCEDKYITERQVVKWRMGSEGDGCPFAGYIFEPGYMETAWDFEDSGKFTGLEVIGNIHENPDLLK